MIYTVDEVLPEELCLQDINKNPFNLQVKEWKRTSHYNYD